MLGKVRPGGYDGGYFAETSENHRRRSRYSRLLAGRKWGYRRVVSGLDPDPSGGYNDTIMTLCRNIERVRTMKPCDHYLGCDKDHASCEAEDCQNPGCYQREYPIRGWVALCRYHVEEYDHHVLKPALKPTTTVRT